MNDEVKGNSESVEIDEELTSTDENIEEKGEQLNEEHKVAEEENVQEQQSHDNKNDETNAEIEDLKAKVEDAENRYLRLYADFENYRRRIRLEQEANEKYKSQQIITNLLPALDNFERAMAIEPDNDQTKALLEGVQMIYRSILDVLKQEGAEPIEAVGKEFDPNLHQAVMQSEDDQYDSNIVVEEFQKGYKLKDRVIRPSMVKVNR